MSKKEREELIRSGIISAVVAIAVSLLTKLWIIPHFGL